MLALTLSLFLSAEGIDLQKTMGSEIYEAAGLAKLSERELGVLSRWVMVYAAKAQAQSAPQRMPGGKIADLMGGYIVASDGRVLGKISRDVMDPDSIANDVGAFGRKFGTTSIMSKLSPYGDTLSQTSAFNPTATAPPKVFIGDKPVAWMTVNPQLKPRVDSKALLGYLGIMQ